MLTRLSVGRPDRSTDAEDGRPDRSTDVHRACTQPGLVGRLTGRSTVQRALLSGNGPGRPGWSTNSIQSRSTGPVDRRHNGQKSDRRHKGQKSDRWAGRPGGRPEGQICPFQLPTGRFLWGYKYRPIWVDFQQVFREQFFPPLQVFNSKFSKEFLGLKDHSLFVFKGWKKSKKNRVFGIFVLFFISIKF